VVHWDLPKVTRQAVAADEVEAELARLDRAVAAVRSLLEELRERTRERAGSEEAKIFDAQISMMEDPDFLGDVENLIRQNQLSAERAFEFKTLEMRALWAQSSGAQLRQRVADLTGIQMRVLNHLVGRPLTDLVQGGEGKPVVVFTRELTPGLTVQFEKEHVAGFASEEGTRISHAAILARGMGIPCVMGLVGGLERIEPGRAVILDGASGTVLLDPSPEEIAAAGEREHLRRALDLELRHADGQPALTLDGTRITLRGNLDLPEELEGAVQYGAEGVGLLRTEFLMAGRAELPGEDEQVVFFERVVKRFPDHPVVIRSYDLGGDKFPVGFRSAAEANPFLGWRAIRVCLDEPDIFRTQIRAVLRARACGDVQLMLPLVTGVEEIERTRELVEEARVQLDRESVPAGADLPIGVMIETPAAAVLADQIAEQSDFLSVGTNDLTQYTIAVDRGNARLAGRFSPLHPAVVRLLQRVAEVGRAAGAEPSVCGEMASDPLSAFLLIGLGYRVLSVAPMALPLIRWFARQIDVAGAERAAAATLDARTPDEVARALQSELAEYLDLDLMRLGRLPGASGWATLNSR
jgi:phosphotransferase system enzyme I (PtsI)